MANTPVHLDGASPARISTNFTVGNQTQNKSFGEKVNIGLQQGANAIASGASLLGSVIPGGAIVSAAVSSVSTHLGGAGASSSAGYAATGVVNVGGGSGGASTINTTVGSSGTGSVVAGTTTGGVNYNTGATTNDVGFGNSAVAGMSGDMCSMLKLQYAMQKENLMYTGISNVIKTKHDTVKNSVSNIR